MTKSYFQTINGENYAKYSTMEKRCFELLYFEKDFKEWSRREREEAIFCFFFLFHFLASLLLLLLFYSFFIFASFEKKPQTLRQIFGLFNAILRIQMAIFLHTYLSFQNSNYTYQCKYTLRGSIEQSFV